jgi:hypothetical protein
MLAKSHVLIQSYSEYEFSLLLDESLEDVYLSHRNLLITRMHEYSIGKNNRIHKNGLNGSQKSKDVLLCQRRACHEDVIAGMSAATKICAALFQKKVKKNNSDAIFLDTQAPSIYEEVPIHGKEELSIPDKVEIKDVKREILNSMLIDNFLQRAI